MKSSEEEWIEAMQKSIDETRKKYKNHVDSDQLESIGVL